MVAQEPHLLFLGVLLLMLEAVAEAMRPKPLVERLLMVGVMALMDQGLLLLELQIEAGVEVVGVVGLVHQMALAQQAALASLSLKSHQRTMPHSQRA
jgi:hypothetical protein